MDAFNGQDMVENERARNIAGDQSVGAETSRSRTEERISNLRRRLEEDVIPRLVQAHRSRQNSVASGSSSVSLTPQQLLDFAELILSSGQASAISFVEKLRSHGLSVEAICLNLLAPTARHLGKLWEADLCDFTRVTVGLSRLQQLLRSFPLETNASPESGKRRDRVLLAPASGEQHSFGLAIVAEFFLRAGWEVTGGGAFVEGNLAQLAEREFFDVVGLSIGCRHHLDALTAEIADIRRVSRNPDVRIMVGGPILTEHPEFATIVNSDAYALDAEDALLQARKLLAVLRQPR